MCISIFKFLRGSYGACTHWVFVFSWALENTVQALLGAAERSKTQRRALENTAQALLGAAGHSKTLRRHCSKPQNA